MNSQSADDLFGRVFPGEKWTIEFTPTVEQSDAMTKHAQSHAQSDAELETFLKMFGILPSESFFNPNARDAWARNPAGVDRTVTCRRGHLWSENTYRTPDGGRYCRACKRYTNSLRNEKKRAAA